ncbi:hypothetical protein [Streptomyces pratensis]|uniref:hypothetical protein n=1 Tax=Streptomyces pratensis TaxID=1169025 RepID=UPI001EE41E4E|nr:hypothetical protein [Streptomyces pratensis]
MPVETGESPVRARHQGELDLPRHHVGEYVVEGAEEPDVQDVAFRERAVGQVAGGAGRAEGLTPATREGGRATGFRRRSRPRGDPKAAARAGHATAPVDRF